MNATADIRPLTMVSRYSVSEAMMLVAVAVASPGTINLEGTYRLNAPSTDHQEVQQSGDPSAVAGQTHCRSPYSRRPSGGGPSVPQAVDILQPRDVDCLQH